MKPSQQEFWQKYIATVQLDLSVVAYTKVPLTWRELDYTPDFNKLYFIMEGEGYLKIGDKSYYPQPGQLYLLPAGVIQSYATINDNTFGKYWCHFTAKLKGFNLFQLVKTNDYIQIHDCESLKNKFEQLIHWQKSEVLTSRIRMTALLLEILAMFIEESEVVGVNMDSTSSLGKIHTVLHYIEEHLSEKLTVERLAQYAHFHPNYFIQVFKRTTGLSPIQYINRMRMEKAKHLLTFTKLSVAVIADSLDMNTAYFSRMFKEHTGFTPSDYRELLLRRSNES